MNMFHKRDVFFIGNFGFTSSQLDGQTIKTRSIYELYCKKLGISFRYFDTDGMKKNKFLIFLALYRIVMCKYIVYMPAYKNLSYFFPIVYLMSVLLRFKIQLFTVGGWFENFITTHKVISKMLMKIHVIYFQTNKLTERMEVNYGFKNLAWIPNFRKEPIKTSDARLVDDTEILKIVFMSRINKKKGIGVIFEFMQFINNTNQYRNFIIDFYGPIYDPDKACFFSNIKRYSNASYKGIISPDSINRTLRSYDVLVLPTKYYTEGFPGAILDAYNAGIPVIVSKWRYAEEFVNDNKTGFIIPFSNNVISLVEKIQYLISNPKRLKEMKSNAYDFSHKFTPEKAWQIIQKKIK